jgi:hypothetical protein
MATHKYKKQIQIQRNGQPIAEHNPVVPPVMLDHDNTDSFIDHADNQATIPTFNAKPLHLGNPDL